MSVDSGGEGVLGVPGEAYAASVTPYRLALRRLRHNYKATVFASLFILVVVLCLLAPVYARYVAHTGPNVEHITEVLDINGKSVDVVSLTGVPVGPTWHSRFFLGADSDGRDLAVRLLYGGRTSLAIGVMATAITIVLATALGLVAGYYGRWTDGVISRVFDIVWAYPALLLAIALGVSLATGGISVGPVQINSGFHPDPDARDRDRLCPVRRATYPRRGARASGARVRGVRSCPRVQQSSDNGERNAPEPHVDPHRLRASPAGPLHNPGGGALFPGCRCPATGGLVGDTSGFGGTPFQCGAVPDVGAGDPPGHHVPGHKRVRRRLAGGPGPARHSADWVLMAHFVMRRLGSAVLVLFAVSILTFLIFEVIPNGNPALRLAGRTATPANIAAVERIYGFNKPVYVQYLRTMEQIFTGRIVSYTTGVNVVSQLKQAIPVTASLVLGAAILWLFFGIVLGLLAGLHAGSTIDTGISALNFVGISAPSFVIGYVLIYLFSFKLHVFPSSGYVGLADPLGWAYHLAMPWVSLSILYTGIYSQILRSSVVDTLNEDFVRTARAKGLSHRRVILHHVLRTSLIPVVSLSGLDVAAVLGGSAIIIEVVFDLPGIGYYASQSIGALDVAPVLVITLFGAFAVVIFSTIADVVYGLLDPRIRVADSGDSTPQSRSPGS